MTTDIRIAKPTLVKVSRTISGPSDLSTQERFIGYLVDIEGNYIEAPIIGDPLFLAGDQTKLPWLFRTDRLYRINVCDQRWDVQTDSGDWYVIEHERLFH